MSLVQPLPLKALKALDRSCQAVAKMVLMNPQGFIDGAPKVGPLGPLGIKVCHGDGGDTWWPPVAMETHGLIVVNSG